MKKLTKVRKPLTAAARSAIERVTSAFDGVPVRARKARKALGALGSDGIGVLKRHPVPSILGALAAGVALKKLARRA